MAQDSDSLRDRYDYITSHNDPHSPYYDGPEEDDDDWCDGCNRKGNLCICDAGENDWERDAACP